MTKGSELLRAFCRSIFLRSECLAARFTLKRESNVHELGFKKQVDVVVGANSCVGQARDTDYSHEENGSVGLSG
jgi:hypothetical protein